MPRWSLNQVLSFLDSPVFEPLETAEPIRLLQKTLFLLFLATGRRIGEVSSLSRQFSTHRNYLRLSCVSGFLPKHHTATFQSVPPVLPYFNFNISPVSHCPVRAFLIYYERSADWFRTHSPLNNVKLWVLPKSSKPLSLSRIAKIFKDLVVDSRYYHDLPVNGISITPHQMRKFAASYSHKVGQDEETVRVAMGFSSVSILRKCYIADVPPLRHPCVLPGGSFSPVLHVISSSDSD